MILCPIIVKNVIETIHKVVIVVAKLSFPLFFTIAFYLMTCYPARVSMAQYNCEVHKSAMLAHLLEALL